MCAIQATEDSMLDKFKNWKINQKINKIEAETLIVKKIKKGTRTKIFALGK